MGLATIQRSAPQKQYQNADGPGGQPINYGPSRGGGVPGQDPFAGGAAPYGASPYYGSQRSTTPMPNSGPGGPPIYTPALNDPRNASYFHNDPTQAPGGAWDQQQAANVSRGQQQIQNDPQAAAALASGDWKTMTSRMQQLGQQAQANRFIQGGGTQQGWDSRFGQAWPTPTMANGTRAPGAPTSAGGPPAMNPNVGSQSGSSMIQGYQPSPMQGAVGGMQGAMGGGQMSPGQMSQMQPGLMGAMQGAMGGRVAPSGQPLNSPLMSTGGNQAMLAADAQRTAPYNPGGFNPAPGGRPVNQPPPGTQPGGPPQGPRQFPGGQPPQPDYGYTPFQGSQWGGNVGYDMGGMSQMFGGGMGGGSPYAATQGGFNPYGGGGYGSNMQTSQGYGGNMGLGNYNQGWGGQGGGAPQFNPQMQMLMAQQGGGFGGGYAPQQQQQFSPYAATQGGGYY